MTRTYITPDELETTLKNAGFIVHLGPDGESFIASLNRNLHTSEVLAALDYNEAFAYRRVNRNEVQVSYA